MTDELRRGLAAHLEALPAPPPQLHTVQRRGRALRWRRRVAAATGAASVAAVTAGVVLSLSSASEHRRAGPPDVALGQLDYSHGLRAFAEPGLVISLGGRTFPADRLGELDTDAAATPYGVVYFGSDHRPRLLQEDGTSRVLHPGPAEGTADFHHTAKADAVEPYVAYGVLVGSTMEVVVHDLATDTVVASRDVDCGGSCEGVRIEAIDSGLVFVRTEAGTFTWSYLEDVWSPFAGPRTDVADARNRVVLYDGRAPEATLPGWSYVPGAIDAQLSFDGKHVLYWSPKLQPVGDGAPIELPLPRPATFFTFDTDGSVLAATSGSPARFYDCPLPSGACEPLGALDMTSGDPMFMGDDM